MTVPLRIPKPLEERDTHRPHRSCGEAACGEMLIKSSEHILADASEGGGGCVHNKSLLRLQEPGPPLQHPPPLAFQTGLVVMTLPGPRENKPEEPQMMEIRGAVATDMGLGAWTRDAFRGEMSPGKIFYRRQQKNAWVCHKCPLAIPTPRSHSGVCLSGRLSLTTWSRH